MAATLQAVAVALKSTLATITGLNAYDVWTLSPTPPFAMLRFLGDSLDTFDGRATYRFEVVFGVSTQNMAAAQRALYALASRSGTGSILATLEAAPTLGGVVETLMAGELAGPLASAEIGAAEYLIGARPLEILVGA